MTLDPKQHPISQQYQSLNLLTDLYQLTMAFGYFKNQMASVPATFHLTFRKPPFGGQYAIASGLNSAIDLLDSFHFSESDLEYVSKIPGADGKPIFDAEFVAFLKSSKFECDVHAIPEGTVVFPHQPLVRLTGPLWQCQLLETALLNIVNFQTLIATKASRVCQAAGDDAVLEFGLRRAQGIDGGISASRAAYVGGCAATSNILAGKIFDIPIRGTHAHSWVMAFEDELESFRAYSKAMPNNCVFLVDTYNTVEGIKKAIEVGKQLQIDNHSLLGVRLDSGDLTALSLAARELLDQAGFQKASIVASNDLDEYEILRLKKAGAKINVWGVGTRLATAYDQPALGGVYKLGAIQNAQGHWEPRIKLSEETIKVSNPGIQQVKRYYSNGVAAADVIVNELDYDPSVASAIDPTSSKEFSATGDARDLLVEIFKNGELVFDRQSATQARAQTANSLSEIPESVRRIENPEAMVVGLDPKMYRLKKKLIDAAKQGTA